jgi:PAS domain S-box-containing protein
MARCGGRILLRWILSKTLDGTITSWNAAAETMYGYPAAEAIGRSIEILVPEDRVGELRAMDERLARGERVAPLDTVRLTRAAAGSTSR